MKKKTLQHLHDLAAHHQLGEPLACIAEPQEPISRLGLLTIIIGLVLIVVLAQLAPFLIALLPLWQVVLVLLIALMWIVVGLWLLASSLMRQKGIETLLCTSGIVWKHRRSIETIRWQDIESLWRKTQGSILHYEVRLRDGRVVVLDSRVPGAEKLARFVEDVLTSRHLPSLMQAYQNAAILKFGTLCISRCGLQVPEHPEVLPWDQIKYMRNIEGVLIVRQKQQVADWATIPLLTVPNVCILEAMVHSLHTLHRTQTPVLERSA